MVSFSGIDISCIRGGRLVFDGLCFSVSSGGALLLTGPNGSGKSTLLRLMAGLIPPTLGELAWDGISVERDPEDHRARLHYLAHAEAVKPPLTVLEDLSFWQALSGSDKPVAAAVDAMGLETQSAVPGRYLSAGQRRRLALARLLVSDAELWLLDEPSVGLDTASLAKLRAAVADHRVAGGIVVAATHVDLGLDGAETLSIDQFAVDPAQMSVL